MKPLINIFMAASVLLFCACSAPEIKVHPKDGHIEYFRQKGVSVPFRSDDKKGPSFEGVTLEAREDGSFGGERDGIRYSIRYSTGREGLTVRCSISNATGTDKPIELRERLYLGLDSEMSSYPQWDTVFFPTLMRCEKDFAWGYFSSPEGGILAFATEEPVASYGLNYLYEGDLEWKWGHRILTGCLDLMHCGPLPERHPAGLDTLRAGQTLSWTIHMGVVRRLEDVKPWISRAAGVPMIELSSYTVPIGAKVKVKTYGARRIGKIDGLTEPGLRKIDCVGRSGKTAEALLFVRPDWEWYARQVRDHIAQYPPRIGNSCEAYYGYLPAFKIARLFPDPEKDKAIAECFERSLPCMIDTATGVPADVALPERVQNFSTLAAISAEYWRATGKIEYLNIATREADYVLSKQTQDGAFRSGGVHYTAVIYPAKSLFDVASAEREAGLTARASRHESAAMQACLDLADRLEDIETEGDMTFEDGMITCSALQMAYAALHAVLPDGTRLCSEAERKKLIDGARFMMERHKCIEQRLIPDCRMRGATLRWWEALDLYFSPNQVMNSPHGWSAWKAYAVAYLYKLTGEESYRRDLDDLLGACAQVLSLDGELRWGFIPDPYVDALVCVPDKVAERELVYERKVVGEQYMPLISTWCRPSSPEEFRSFGEFGGAGDGTVFEIFNAIVELEI